MYNNGPAAPAGRVNSAWSPARAPAWPCPARTNETVKQRSMILIDPGATCRQLGYILIEECPFKKPKTSTAAAAAAAAATAAAAAAAAAVVVAREKKKREGVQQSSDGGPFRRCELMILLFRRTISAGIIVKNESFRSKSSFKSQLGLIVPS